jgi:cyclopropane-fatty-acyl-phospholipid synthase
MAYTISGPKPVAKALGFSSSPAERAHHRPAGNLIAPETFASVPAAGRMVARILARADIHVNGDRPWDIRVHDERFYRRLIAEGGLGAGESYMDGWWDVEALADFFCRVHRADLQNSVGQVVAFWHALKGRILNLQTKTRSRKVAEAHYDLGNDLYQAMLDKNLQYTCAYWKDASTLDQAQENKLRLICRKLQLASGMTVLELGGGFGGLAHFMVVEYGCRVVSYNISSQQVKYGRDLYRGLPVRFEEQDYREAIHETERFHRVVAIGLCEHIGHKNYRAFLELGHRLLWDEGLFLLHTIGGNQTVTRVDPWIDKYIFPNGMIPSVKQLGKAMEGLWVVEDWHNFGPDYDKTLLCWWENFAQAWPRLRVKYDRRFYRIWKYYLLGSAGAFRARQLQLWQIVLSKGDIPSYTPVR